MNIIPISEPGYYEDGKFGIRIESLVLVVKKETQVGLTLLMIIQNWFTFGYFLWVNVLVLYIQL